MTFLLVLVVLVGIGVVGFLAYYGGTLLSRAPKQPPPMSRAQFLVMPTMPSRPPAPPTRMARGTTPQPLSHEPAYGRAESPIPGVISNRDDATERTVQPDDRFSIRRSRPRY